MTIHPSTVHDLCLRAATGDPQARKEFDRYVPPLVEIVVRRWLHQERHQASPSAAFTARRARQLTDDLCARMLAGSGGRCRSGTSPGETLVMHRCGDTIEWPARGALLDT